MVAPSSPPSKAPTTKGTYLAKLGASEVGELVGGAMTQIKNRTKSEFMDTRSAYVENGDSSTARDLPNVRSAELDELRERLRRSDNELQSIRQTNSELCDSVVSFKTEMQKLERKKQEVSSLNNCLSSKVHDLQNQLDGEAKSIEVNAHENRMLKECKAVAEKDLAELQKECAIQQKELRNCRDDLFSLQLVVQFTDSEILSQYDGLCQQISNWVDKEIFLFEDAFSGCLNQPWAVVDRNIATFKWFLQDFPEGGENLVGALIHNLLQKFFVQPHRRPFGFPEVEGNWVDKVAERMAELEPKRDPSTIKIWRCDTIQAALMVPRIAEARSEAIKKAAEELLHILRCFFPGLVNEGLSRLLEEVIKPAAELDVNICVSYTDYSITSMDDTLLLQRKSITRETAALYTLIDTHSGKRIKADTPMAPNSHGHVGQLLSFLEPALSRLGKDNSVTELRKGKYLFEACALLRRQSRMAT